MNLSSSKTKALDCEENLDTCESKLGEKIKLEEEECHSVIQSGEIPQYGPTQGDRCISPGGDETGKYSMQHSIESYGVIAAYCKRSPGNVFENLIILSFEFRKIVCLQFFLPILYSLYHMSLCRLYHIGDIVKQSSKIHFRLRNHCEIQQTSIHGCTGHN